MANQRFGITVQAAPTREEIYSAIELGLPTCGPKPMTACHHIPFEMGACPECRAQHMDIFLRAVHLYRHGMEE